MDEYLQNCSEDIEEDNHEDELFQEGVGHSQNNDLNSQNVQSEQKFQNYNPYHDGQVQSDFIQSNEQQCHSTEMVQENKIINHISNEKVNKQKLFHDEMILISSRNFKLNFSHNNNDQNEDNVFNKKTSYSDLNSIKEALKMQMEYYFSDSNLIHDKYLRSIIEKSPNQCVDIKLFLKFKRIQQILEPIEKGIIQINDQDINIYNKNNCLDNQEINNKNNNKNINNNNNNQKDNSKKQQIILIRDSLFNSVILKVKKDSLKIKRVYPFEQKQAQLNQNKRTVYIDYLPHKCNKQILLQIFDSYQIVNINLPLQKNSELCKGYAFIEFSTKDEVNHAIQTKNSSIPKELVVLADNKLGQGSIRIITFDKWEQEKQTFKNLTTSNSNKNNEGSKRKESYEFHEADINIINNTLIKIIDIPQNTLKTEIVLAIRHLGYEFYCDYQNQYDDEQNKQGNQNEQNLDNKLNKIEQKQQKEMIQENSMDLEMHEQDQKQQNINNNKPDISKILKPGQAMIRFKNEKDRQDVVRQLFICNKSLSVEIKSKLCQIMIVSGDEEILYWEYVKFKKNEFRQFFYQKKILKKQKIQNN